MRLPFITSQPARSEQSTGAFGGLNEKLVISESEFSAMKNMSDRYYPAIATREGRSDPLNEIATPNGLYWKNHLFWVDGTKCYFNGQQVSGLTVTNGKKQLVGMGAYIVIFPDKKIFNTATGEVTAINASYTQSGTITFAELSTDSVFTKITATGIHNTFKQYDGVKIEGVGDDAFVVDGEGVTKVITEIGTNYIVVTASIQNSFSGELSFSAQGSYTRITGTGIGSKFAVNDVVRVIGCETALNVENKAVVAKGTNYIDINFVFPSKTYSQGSTSMKFEPYFAGSDKTKITAANLNTIFSTGDVVTIAGCTNSAYNGPKEILLAGTDFIVVSGTLSTAFTQASGVTMTRARAHYDTAMVKRTAFTRSSGITFTRESPNFDYVCEHDNRLWGCNSLNHEIYASKLGDPTNWNCYEGASTDSYTVTVGSDGDFTGCVSHLGYVIFFKEQTIHMMYGSKPTNYQLQSENLPGVREGCSESLCVVGDTLYYVGRNGVYTFDGAFPQKISDVIESEIFDAVCSQQDNKLYMSCLKDGERALLVYDPVNRIWDQEDDTQFKYAIYGDGKLYYIAADNNLYNITGDNTDRFEWSITSGVINSASLNMKHISKIKYHFLLEAGSEANVYMRYDDDPMWQRKGTIYSDRRKTYTLPIIAHRCDHFQWKIEGQGQMKLLAFAYTMEGGSELNGYIQHGFHR